MDRHIEEYQQAIDARAEVILAQLDDLDTLILTTIERDRLRLNLGVLRNGTVESRDRARTELAEIINAGARRRAEQDYREEMHRLADQHADNRLHKRISAWA